MNLSFKHYYWRWLKNLSLLFVFMTVSMTVARMLFGFYFAQLSELTADYAILKSAFFLGLRYDLMPLAYINLLPFIWINIGYFLKGKLAIRFMRLSVSTIVFLGYVAIAWIYIFDYAFYSYFQDHINILFFGFFEDDTIALLVSIWKNYNLILWLSAIIGMHYFLYRAVKFAFSPFDFDLKVKSFSWWMPVTFISGLIVLGFFGRGNFSRLPLSVEDSHLSSNEFINKLSQNGILTLNRALKIRKTFGTREYDYMSKYGFKDWRETFTAAFGVEPKADSLLKSLTFKTEENLTLARIKPHVVLVVMESFGSYWNDKSSSSFNLLGELETHFKDGMLFNNFLSSENGTIGSMVSIATSQPIRPGARFLSESSFMKVPLSSAGHLPYKAAGYDTHFIYGGKLGWRDLGKYLSTQKYDHLWGAEEIREAMPELNNIEERDLGNEWGIFDEYLYAFIEEQLRYATKPQFFLVLTTSNHPPFEYPSTYNILPIKLDAKVMDKVTVDEEMARKRFSGFQYANQKMGEFLSKIKLSAMNEKTVVALTGDHSYWITKGVGADQEFKRYAVPFYIHAPSRLRPKKVNLENVGSHEDIFPTLYHLSLSNVEYIKLGENLFAEEGFAINSAGISADKTGAFHHEKFWEWSDFKGMQLRPIQNVEKMNSFRRKRDALISITDLYLKEEKNRKRPASKNDQQEQSSP